MLPSRFALRLAGLCLLLLLLVGLVPVLQANVQRLQTLKMLPLGPESHSLDEASWEMVWQQLCATPAGAADSLPAGGSPQTLYFTALADLERGAYGRARDLFVQLADEPTEATKNAPAYAAALQLDWLTAAQLYQPEPTPRTRRWWGTVFYLAAQQLMFRGDPAGAADWYRRADAAYDVQGPYTGLALVDCLDQAGRSAEAFDAYRRGLVTLPPDEALAHRARFDALRLAGLGDWLRQDPANERVASWLAFYTADDPAGPEPVPLANPPEPGVGLVYDLDPTTRLLGFDYRPEDIQTGPFMVVTFYLQDGPADAPAYGQVTATVLNQAPNGAFSWDAVPDGVRPAGWNNYVYEPDTRAIVFKNIAGQTRWLCFEATRIQRSFGLAGGLAHVDHPLYAQGGLQFSYGPGVLTEGRFWLPGQGTDYPYNYLPSQWTMQEVVPLAGVWLPDNYVEQARVWLFVDAQTQACTDEVYLIGLPELP